MAKPKDWQEASSFTRLVEDLNKKWGHTYSEVKTLRETIDEIFDEIEKQTQCASTSSLTTRESFDLHSVDHYSTLYEEYPMSMNTILTHSTTSSAFTLNQTQKELWQTWLDGSGKVIEIDLDSKRGRYIASLVARKGFAKQVAA